MKYKTHIVFGILLYLLFFKLEVLVFSFFGFFILFVGSLLPDIDKHTSFIGRKIKLMSFSLELIFSHRGLFHSLWVAFLCLFISFELFIGYLSHLILDMLNPKGVKLFWPWFKVKGHIKSGGLTDFFVLVFIILLILLLLFI
ncbi:MAG: metal-dependent hydrolase [Candidatus Woesearchaeota archaeon]